jgi:DNA-binding CsgD family transcriptional regulator
MEMQGESESAVSARAMADREGLGAGLALLMDEFAHGVLVVNSDAKVLHANQAARHELSRGHGLAIQGHQLQTADAETGKLLLDALNKAAEGKRSLVSLPAGRHPRLSMAVLPLPPEGVGRSPKVALVLSRATVCESIMLCFFARNHGLTGAEEQVLGFLCQGYSAPETAAQLKVAVSTVRSHVRSLCAKTGSSGMRELVSRVAVLPPVAPYWHEPVH